MQRAQCAEKAQEILVSFERHGSFEHHGSCERHSSVGTVSLEVLDHLFQRLIISLLAQRTPAIYVRVDARLSEAFAAGLS